MRAVRRPLPITSHGYRPPRGARVLGWRCPRCGRCSEPDEGPPRRWPHPCPECAEPVDPTFDEPWFHDAEGYRLRHLCHSTERHVRILAEADLPRWEYEDAVRTGVPAVVAKARAAFEDSVGALGEQHWSVPLALSRCRVVEVARRAGDLDFAAAVILAWYPTVETRDLEHDSKNDPRAEARIFVEACIAFLDGRDAIGHAREAEVMEVMNDVAARADSVLMSSQQLGRQRVMHLRATVSELARFAELARSPLTPFGPADGSPGSRLGRLLRPRRARDVPACGAIRFGRARDWQKAARRSAGSPLAEQTRLATEWVAWALENDEPDLVADAYEHLIPLIPRVVAARHGAADRDELLWAAQEHAEEAGYWLCRAGRYRAAAIALETGRAVALSVADDPSPPVVGYGDVVTVNDDGAVVYVAAAKAGGYALVVAGGHDPQYVELPRYDRASVATLLDEMLPDPAPEDRRSRSRDMYLPGAGEVIGTTWTDRMAWLWRNGLDMIMFLHAHGRMVTLVPVGLLSLLPLHAAGVSQDRHAGMFSAVRYAPNVRTLDRCRSVAAACSSRPLSLLVADVPDGHGLSGGHLHYADDETTAVAEIWTNAGREQRLHHRCRWADFRRHADDCSVWHIACHGDMRSSDTFGTAAVLYFADAEVGIEQLRAEIRHAPRRLAILSACHSHLTSASLPNEIIGLPSALLELGFAGVIATTWAIDDAATPYLMAYFHRIWCSDDMHPAVALNRAQRWLARATRAELLALLPAMGRIAAPGERPFADPLYWAGFAYTGA